MTKAFALWVILTALTGEVEVRPMDMKFEHPADCQYAANYFNSRATFGTYDADPFYYCQIVRQEGNL